MALLFFLEEKFAQAVCFLLVDLYLLTFQPEKALHLLAVLDKLSAQGSNKNNKGEVFRCSLIQKAALIFIRIIIHINIFYMHHINLAITMK